jgi:hypothetical protein
MMIGRCQCTFWSTGRRKKSHHERANACNPATATAGQSISCQGGRGKTISKYRKDQIVFSQGQVAVAVFYIQLGKVKLAVLFRARQGSGDCNPGTGSVFEEAMNGKQQGVLRQSQSAPHAGETIVSLDPASGISDELRRRLLLLRFWQSAAGFWGAAGGRGSWLLTGAILPLMLLNYCWRR